MNNKIVSKRSEAALGTLTAFIVSCLIYQGFASYTRDIKENSAIKQTISLQNSSGN